MEVTPVNEVFGMSSPGECILNCQQVHEHTKNCPVCSQLYYSYIETYLKIIMMMLAVLIFLFMIKILRL